MSNTEVLGVEPDPTQQKGLYVASFRLKKEILSRINDLVANNDRNFGRLRFLNRKEALLSIEPKDCKVTIVPDREVIFCQAKDGKCHPRGFQFHKFNTQKFVDEDYYEEWMLENNIGKGPLLDPTKRKRKRETVKPPKIETTPATKACQEPLLKKRKIENNKPRIAAKATRQMNHRMHKQRPHHFVRKVVSSGRVESNPSVPVAKIKTLLKQLLAVGPSTLHKLRLHVKNYLGPKLDAEYLKGIASKVADGATSLDSICSIKMSVFNSLDREELINSEYLTGRQIREILDRMEPESSSDDVPVKPTMHPVVYPKAPPPRSKAPAPSYPKDPPRPKARPYPKDPPRPKAPARPYRNPPASKKVSKPSRKNKPSKKFAKPTINTAKPASNKVAAVKKQKPKKEKEPLNAEHLKEFAVITGRVEYMTVKSMFNAKLAEYKKKNQELEMFKSKMLQRQGDVKEKEQQYFTYHNNLKQLNMLKGESKLLRDLLAVLKFRVNEFVATHKR